MALPKGNVPVNENDDIRQSLTDLQLELQNLAAEIQELKVHQDSKKDDSDTDGSSIYTDAFEHEENTQWELGFKLEIPEFHGHGGLQELLDWFITAEAVMDFKRVPSDRRVSLVATCFRGRAAAWWNQLKASRARLGKPKIATWDKLKKHIFQRFLPNYNYDQILCRKLQDLRQGNKKVDEYATEFSAILSGIEVQETETQLVARFIGGLNPQLQYNLNSFRPLTVSEAHQLANIVQERERGAAARTVPVVASRSLVPHVEIPAVHSHNSRFRSVRNDGNVDEIKSEYFCFGLSTGLAVSFAIIFTLACILEKDN